MTTSLAYEDVVPLLRGAAPSYGRWRLARFGGIEDDEELPYGEASYIAEYVVTRISEPERGDLVAIFRALEDVIERGTPAAVDLAHVGVLEDIQNIALNRRVSLNAFRPFLGPRAEAAWDELIDGWKGRSGRVWALRRWFVKLLMRGHRRV